MNDNFDEIRKIRHQMRESSNVLENEAICLKKTICNTVKRRFPIFKIMLVVIVTSFLMDVIALITGYRAETNVNPEVKIKKGHINTGDSSDESKQDATLREITPNLVAAWTEAGVIKSIDEKIGERKVKGGLLKVEVDPLLWEQDSFEHKKMMAVVLAQLSIHKSVTILDYQTGEKIASYDELWGYQATGKDKW